MINNNPSTTEHKKNIKDFLTGTAELIFENEFPKNIQGIWSADCEENLQIHIIGSNSSLWIDEDYVGLNISQTSNVQNWTAYKWGEIDGSYYYFLKTNITNVCSRIIDRAHMFLLMRRKASYWSSY